MTKREKVRTNFGERLFKARKHAGLTQVELAKLAGIAQSTMTEAETTANGSTKVMQLAKATGVNPDWLATGKGEMLDRRYRLEDQTTTVAVAQSSSPSYGGLSATRLSVTQLVLQLGEVLEQQDALTRVAIAPLLQRLASNPEERARISQMIGNAMGSGNEPAPKLSSSLGGQTIHKGRIL